MATGDTQAPSVPTNLNATAVSGSQIDLTWTASTDDVGVTGYTIFRDGAPIVPNVTTTTFQDTGLNSSTPYTYTVLAFDAAGNNSAQSAEDSATTLANLANLADSTTYFADSGNFTVGNPVSGLWDTITTTPGTVSTSGSFWVEYDLGQLYDLSQSRFFGDADGTWVSDTYNLKVKSAAGDAYTSIITGADAFANQWFETSLTGTQARFVRLEVFGGSGAQALEFEVYGTVATGDTQAPSVPTNLNATAVSSSQIDLTWTASTDNVGVTGYTIFRDGAPIVPNVTTTTFQDTGLNSSTPYTYTVLAFDAAGNNSAQSAEDSATTLAQSGNFIYVDDDGNASGDGSSSNPFNTIQKAANVAVAGDTVLVRDGTYTDSDNDGDIFNTVNSGTSSNWITFKSENKWGAVLDGENRTATRIITFRAGDHYIRIEGFDMTQAKRGVTINASNHDVYLFNNTIHHLGVLNTSTTSGQSGVYSGQFTFNITVDSNRFEEIGRDGTSTNHDHGIYLGGGPVGPSDVLIKNNVFINRDSGWPIHIFSSDETSLFSNITITNNTFDKPNTTRDGHIILGANVDNLLIQNNIFSDPRETAITILSGCGTRNIDLVLHNNITHSTDQNTPTLIDNECEGFEIGVDNLTSTGPMFTDAENGGYTLLSSSPAIDAGTATDAPNADFDGNSRPIDGDGVGGAQYDIGAFEFVPPSALLAPEGETFGSTVREYEVFGDASQPVAAEMLSGVSQPTQSELFDVALGELIGASRDELSTQLRYSSPRQDQSLDIEPSVELAEGFAASHRFRSDTSNSRFSGENSRGLKPTTQDREEIFDSLFTDFDEVLAP